MSSVALLPDVQGQSSLGDAVDDLWSEDPGIYRLLRASETLEAARQALYTYLKDVEWHLRGEKRAVLPVEYATAVEALRVLYDVLSPRNEHLVGFSTLESLWCLARGEANGVTPGFVEEFRHLFRAIHGRSSIGQGWLGPLLAEAGVESVDFRVSEGQAASEARSHYLDQVAQHVHALTARHPSGLDPEVIRRREENRARILAYFGATLDQWYNPDWQLGHIFKDAEGLAHLQRLVPLTEEEVEAITLALANEVPFGITPYYLSLFDFNSADRRLDGQVRSQVIPPLHYVKRMIEHREEREHYFDFMGEHDTSPVDLVTRRYPLVAIVKPFDTCPQICVYCQRNWEIAGPMAAAGVIPCGLLDRALDWFEVHTGLRDVLVTGGDPLFLSDGRIKYIMNRLSSIGHLVHVRWGTRALVTVPMRVTEALADLLGSYIVPGRRNVSVVTHVESAAEVTPDVAAAVSRLRRRGIYVYNQQVFTVQTSRRFQTVANRIALKLAGIDPYYTFYAKGKEETRDYLVPLARIAQERKEEARLLPGVFRTDEPVFNVPRLGKNHIRAWQDRELLAIRPDGSRVYFWHPWEKGITPTEPWAYTDVPILDYLRQLEQIGEDPADYETIWYYY